MEDSGSAVRTNRACGKRSRDQMSTGHSLSKELANAEADRAAKISRALDTIDTMDEWDDLGNMVARKIRKMSNESIQEEAAQVIMAELFRFTAKDRRINSIIEERSPDCLITDAPRNSSDPSPELDNVVLT